MTFLEPAITSASNPLLKRVRRLRARKHREREGVFFVEGIQSVWQAVRNRADIEAILLAPELLRSDRAVRMVREQEKQGTKVIGLGIEAFTSIADRDDPSGLAALVRARIPTLAQVDAGPGTLLVALDRVEKPGNVGSIIRSADAAGAGAVIVIGDSTDPYHPTAVKASMGTLFNVPVAPAESVDEVLGWAGQYGLNVVGTSAHAETPFWSVTYKLPALLLFGNEGTGLDEAVLRRVEKSVRIPMRGTASSLNLAVAVGIVLYELRRQQELN